jgi:MOSC domain-containing protein YiiM
MPDANGHVEAIFVGETPGEVPVAVDRAHAVAGRGLEGDRYFAGVGSFSDKGRGNGRDLTLIQAEALEGLASEDGIELTAAESRRNVVTRGVDLHALIGQRFRIGGATCLGVRRCEPCTHLEGLTRPGVLKGLAGRGSLRADIVDGGTIRVGDAISPEPA